MDHELLQQTGHRLLAQAVVRSALLYERSNVSKAVGADDEEDVACATVTVTPAGGQVWVYASKVDNQSGHGTTIPVLVLEGE